MIVLSIGPVAKYNKWLLWDAFSCVRLFVNNLCEIWSTYFNAIIEAAL